MEYFRYRLVEELNEDSYINGFEWNGLRVFQRYV